MRCARYAAVMGGKWQVTDLVGDVAAGDWIRDAVWPFGRGIGWLVPPVFEAYRRVLHPAYGVGVDFARWADVAAYTGAVMHPTVEWGSILEAGVRSGHGIGDQVVWGDSPRTGDLEPSHRQALAAVLATFTTTPDDCWFGVWEGQSFRGVDQDGPRLVLPGRGHLLFHGRVADAGKAFQGHGPSIWWPADRAWLVATDVDLMATYLGSSVECARAVDRAPLLEVLETTVDRSVTWDSDTINPLPSNPFQ